MLFRSGLNRISKKDRYPLPLLSDLLDTPKKARVYTKIDLCHAYHLVRIADGEEWKTTFCTCYGSFEWLVIPFRLMNAPATFQRFMNNIFHDLLDVCIIVYLNNILIYSIDEVMYHKNLEYFAMTKLLTRCQAQWSEYLSQFNMVIRFHPGKLGMKPDALTR